jgi:hypothetical protein
MTCPKTRPTKKAAAGNAGSLAEASAAAEPGLAVMPA